MAYQILDSRDMKQIENTKANLQFNFFETDEIFYLDGDINGESVSELTNIQSTDYDRTLSFSNGVLLVTTLLANNFKIGRKYFISGILDSEVGYILNSFAEAIDLEDKVNIDDIDQTYNPESENAQSGVAVAEATEWIVLADTTLDETTANVKSVNIEVDKEKADICSEYLFEIEFTIDVDYVSPIFMVCLRTGWANNVLSYAHSSNTYNAGTTLRTYSFALRDGKLMYSIYRPLHTSNEFNSTATPETTTSFGYDTENNRRSLDLWFNTEHTFPVGTHIRLIGRR